MINQIFHVPLSYSVPTSIFIFGDLQWTRPDPRTGQKDGPLFDTEAWEMFEHEAKTTPNAWFLGMGDYGDWLRPSMRARVQASLAGDRSAQSQLDSIVYTDQDALIKKLSFMEGKIVGLHSGHHEWDFLNGSNSTQRICSGLKAPYLGWSAGTRLVLQDPNPKSNISYAYSIYSTHGNRNSSKAFERNQVASYLADHYIHGHACISDTWEPHEYAEIRKKGPAGMKVHSPQCMMVGGFSKSFTNGWETSYAEKAGYRPQPRRWGVIRIKVVARMDKAKAAGIRCRGKTLDIEQVTRGPKGDADTYRGGI